MSLRSRSHRFAHLARRWILLAVMGALSACGEVNTSDLVDFVEAAHRDSKPEIEPLPEIRLYEKFVYSASALPDPFAVLNLLPGDDGPFGSGISPDTNRRQEPLEKYSLDELLLVGSIQRNGEIWAIVRAPDGTVHRITNGNYLGMNFGRVVNVANYRVELK
ncbi:MAG: pilus assembly protein PilP, partial [Proteobacteria bacterium]|nr:pilus assembly protein PilP [Pseudomonadota bacterium]